MWRRGCRRGARRPPARRTSAAARSPAETRGGSFVVVLRVEVEHLEQVADGRHVQRHVGVVGGDDRIRQVVAAATGQRLQAPGALDELYDRGVISVVLE